MCESYSDYGYYQNSSDENKHSIRLYVTTFIFLYIVFQHWNTNKYKHSALEINFLRFMT